MLAKINPKYILPGLAVVAVTIVALLSFGVIGGDTDEQQAANKTSTKQTAKTTNARNTKQTSSNKRSSSDKRKIVRVSRPGMKYRIVRVVEEPKIEPSGTLRKKTASSDSGDKNENLAKN